MTNAIAPNVVKALALEPNVLLTKVRVRLKARLGGYSLDVENDFVRAITTLLDQDALDEIEEISGVARTSGDKWFAFRLDGKAIRIAANAPQEAKNSIAPELQRALATPG